MTNKDIFRELGGLDPELIVKADPEVQMTAKPHTRFPIYKKAIAGAAALLLAISLVALNYDAVSAAARRLFSFIPGVGIQMELSETVYAYQPIKDRVESGENYAELLYAVYADGTLSAVVQFESYTSYSSPVDVTVSTNGVPVEANINCLAGSEHALIDIRIQTETPTDTSLYEIKTEGINDKLSFSLKPCESYESLSEIGPTVTKNNISLTVTTHRNENELFIWYYAIQNIGSVKDEIVGFGTPANGGWNNRRYVVSESGTLIEKNAGWQLRNRSVYEIQETDKSATLHIPYLAMRHDENAKMRIFLPEKYGTFDNKATAKTSLGHIRVVSVERTPDEHDQEKDRVILRFSFDNIDENKRMYAFNSQTTNSQKGISYPGNADGETEYLMFTVDKETQKLTLSIDSIYYYLMGEYEIPLDIQ